VIWQVGVQLKAILDNLYGVPGGKFSECFSEISLADIIEGTHAITPDIDAHLCVHVVYDFVVKNGLTDG